MTLELYLASEESKYAVIRAESYKNNPVARSISDSPRTFERDGVSLVLLSLEPLAIPELVDYVSKLSAAIEFELTSGGGKVTLLLHSQVLKLLESESNQSSQFVATKE